MFIWNPVRACMYFFISFFLAGFLLFAHTGSVNDFAAAAFARGADAAGLRVGTYHNGYSEIFSEYHYCRGNGNASVHCDCGSGRVFLRKTSLPGKKFSDAADFAV